MIRTKIAFIFSPPPVYLVLVTSLENTDKWRSFFVTKKLSFLSMYVFRSRHAMSLAPRRAVYKPSRHMTVYMGAPGLEEKEKFGLTYFCGRCDMKTDYPALISVRFLGNTIHNTFEVREITFHFIFCEHLDVCTHNFKKHRCSNKHA